LTAYAAARVKAQAAVAPVAAAAAAASTTNTSAVAPTTTPATPDGPSLLSAIVTPLRPHLSATIETDLSVLLANLS
jgi:hypothetical protein